MFGTLEVGMVPGQGRHQWVFEEVMGGGVMAIGVTRDPGDLFVVLLKAGRFNLMGGDGDYEVPGGFQEPGEVAMRGLTASCLRKPASPPNSTPCRGASSPATARSGS